MSDATDQDRRPAFLAVSGEIATIVLNRPEAYNAIDRDMAERLRDLARAAAANAAVKIVVVRGEGPAFCGGGDIRHFVSNLDEIGPCIRALLTPYHEFLEQLRTMAKLTVASVHGSAAGAGLSLAAMCDLCIAADDANFTPAYAKIGVSPDGGGTYGLARAIGARRALHAFLGEDRFTAAQAAEWGLVTKLVPAAALAEETALYAARLARTSAEAVAGTKRLLHASAEAPLPAHLEDEMETLIGCMATETFVTAVTRFVKKG
ncbi:MAG TPA: enoyl-CoA hydratase-related protein [Allosphingosinicella sp.]|nr:enoyl-CoA hydratase-related protein [Allosphingosinicella sp.]